MSETEPTGWVVVFLRVDQPGILVGTDNDPHIFANKEEAEKHRRAIGEGTDKEHGYLKGAWARVVVWSIAAWWRYYRGETTGRVVLPVHHLGGGLTVDDMDPNSYE